MIWQYTVAHHRRSVQYQRIEISPTQEAHVVTTTDLSLVPRILNMSTRQGPGAEKLVRIPITSDGPWRNVNQELAWEQYFEAEGYSPHARCSNHACPQEAPLIITSSPGGAHEHEQAHSAPGMQQDTQKPSKGVRWNDGVKQMRNALQQTKERRQLEAFCAHCW